MNAPCPFCGVRAWRVVTNSCARCLVAKRSSHAELRVLVCGGRDYSDAGHVYSVLDMHHARWPITLIIVGDASGADSAAERWARDHGVARVKEYAAWNARGRAAGPIRNRKMLTEHRPDLVLAFPGGPGTADMVRQSRAAGVHVIVVAPEAV